MRKTLTQFAAGASAALLAFLGVLVSSSAAADLSGAVTTWSHAYDTPVYDAHESHTAPERGPPAKSCAYTIYDAVDLRLHGISGRSESTSTPENPTTYDASAVLVQIAQATSTTQTRAEGGAGGFSPSAPSEVAANGAQSAVQGSRVVSGRFPRNAGPDDILVRRGADGGVTHYQTYGPDGLPLKRVDVTGRAHGGVDTPHVVEFERHVNPATGEVFVRPGSTVRPATPEELMGLD